jgi:hypothetical protein
MFESVDFCCINLNTKRIFRGEQLRITQKGRNRTTGGIGEHPGWAIMSSV